MIYKDMCVHIKHMYLYSNWTYLDHQPFFNPSIRCRHNSHEFCFNHVTKTCHQPIQEGRRLQFSRQWRRHILAMVWSLEAKDCCHQENSHADCWSSETNCVCVPHIWHFIHHSPPSWVTCMVQGYNLQWISYRNFILMQRPATTRP